MNNTSPNIIISGMGVVTPVGVGCDEFTTALKQGHVHFSTTAFQQGERQFTYPLAPLSQFNFRESLSSLELDPDLLKKAKRLRNLSTSAACGLRAALEAWSDAQLSTSPLKPDRIAIVASGSNTQQASLVHFQEKYASKLQFLTPNYGFNYFDTDLVGMLSELLQIKGEGHSIGTASASGNMALIQGYRLIASQEYDAVIVVAPMMDLSKYEFQGFTALGAMANLEKKTEPARLCRPFDTERGGFIYGQSAACVILEAEARAVKRGIKTRGQLLGYGVNLDGNRNPNPSVEGEQLAMEKAVEKSQLSATDIDYVNAHGTASPIGDKVETEALLAAGFEGVKVNSTKSLIGHGLSAAGVVEAVASLVQLQEGFLHPTHNLSTPISEQLDFVQETIPFEGQYAMSNSFAFGGVNTSIILKKN